MLTNVRQKLIKDMAAKDGEVVISKAAKALNVSIETIRRDINAMCEKDILQKVHGGAILKTKPIFEPDYNERKSQGNIVKNKLGLYAANFVESNQVISFCAGLSIEAVARHISNVENICAITNSLPCCEILASGIKNKFFSGRVVMLGGYIDSTEHFTYGAAAIKHANKYYADISFLGVGAINEECFSGSGEDECRMAEIMLSMGRKKILVAESRKFNSQSLFKIAPLKEVDIIITDDEFEISKEIKKAIAKYNIELHIVE